jgi:hypothetical protein
MMKRKHGVVKPLSAGSKFDHKPMWRVLFKNLPDNGQRL